jgi:hypothetical protein
MRGRIFVLLREGLRETAPLNPAFSRLSAEPDGGLTALDLATGSLGSDPWGLPTNKFFIEKSKGPKRCFEPSVI